MACIDNEKNFRSILWQVDMRYCKRDCTWERVKASPNALYYVSIFFLIIQLQLFFGIASPLGFMFFLIAREWYLHRWRVKNMLKYIADIKVEMKIIGPDWVIVLKAFLYWLQWRYEVMPTGFCNDMAVS